MKSIAFEDIETARKRIESGIVKTQLLRSETMSHRSGCDLTLKFENHQFTASFKERGALNKILTLPHELRAKGVVAASAGNHAQALARHGALLDIPVRVVMPKFTPNVKIQYTKVFGAEVILDGENVDESMKIAHKLAVDSNATLVHPFDDYSVIEGQGTIGIEILEQDPDIETVIVPVGGGGLICGIAAAVKHLKPQARIIGVQVDTFNRAYSQFHSLDAEDKPWVPSIAEGIAVKHPGEITGRLIQELVDDIVQVSERDVESAIFSLLEIEKNLVEGAGASALAAVLKYPNIARGRTALIISGGNIDMMTLSGVLQRGLVRTSRLVKIRVLLPDIPGELAKVAQHFGALDSNIVDIDHHRTVEWSTLNRQPLDILLHLRGEEQTDLVLSTLRNQGYEVELLAN